MQGNRRIILIFSLILTLVIFGTAGYIIIGGWNFLDALYMTIISITTVGYGEVRPLSPAGRIFTMVLLTMGVGLFFYAVTSLAEYAVEGRIKGLWEKRRMEKAISSLSQHFIICGYGRIGRSIADNIYKEGHPIVVIENDPATIKDANRADFLYIEGDATQDEYLIKAGIERAKGIICVLRSDADNVYITLTSRLLNPGLLIVARAGDPRAEKRMIQAGANRVVSPYEIGARRMALAVLKPTVIEFLDLALHSSVFDIFIEEVTIDAKSAIDGLSLQDAGLRQKTGVTVLAIQKLANKMILSPDPHYILKGGDAVITLGSQKGLAEFRLLAKSNTT
ncbi:MAG: potassium channel protein [Desulfobacteraceae bacterium]|nr:potassium channel protein [Desulfobacteraceae bacterium]